MQNKIKKEKILQKSIQHIFIRKAIVSKGGRNNTGHITIRFKGGGHKRCFRLIDFQKILWNITGLVIRFDYAPAKTCILSLICYFNGILAYHAATEGVSLGDYIFVGVKKINFSYNRGDVSFLSNFVDGMFLHNLELYPKKGSQIVRAAGTFAQLLKINYNNSVFSLVKLPSKEERLFFNDCIATVGQVSNINHFLIKFDTAGIKRHLGKRPHVRGVAMNPIDHPHGGGQGKTSGAGGRRSQVTYKGKVAKGQRTNKNLNKFVLVS